MLRTKAFQLIAPIMVLCILILVSCSSTIVVPSEPTTFTTVVDLLWVEQRYAKFSFTWITDDTESVSTLVYIHPEQGRTATEAEVDLIPNVPVELEFDQLSAGQNYRIGIQHIGEDLIHWLADFRTFHSFTSGEGLQLFYWLDLTKPKTNMVDVRIFGYFMNIPMIQLDNSGYHTQGGMIRAQNIALEANPNLNLQVSNDKKTIDIDLNHHAEGYFSLSYSSDKSAIVAGTHGIQGYFGLDYLIASHEQLLYGPGGMIHRDFFLSQDPLNFQAHLSLMLPSGWDSATGWERVSRHLYKLPDVYRPSLWEFFQAGHIYAYRKDGFEKNAVMYGDHVFEIILSKHCTSGTLADIQRIYDQLVSIWGRVIETIPQFTIIITEPPRNHPQLLVYAGEWTTGQGFSRNWGPIGEMLIHQIYHLWNAWAFGLPWDWETYHWGFWSEGFNVFYSDKLLTEITFLTTTWEDHTFLRSSYQRYADIRNTPEDLNLLTDDLSGSTIHYWKGAVYAFAFDREIRNRTNGHYCLDDVLKHLWNQYEQNGTPGSYSAILDYLRDVVPGGMDDWWNYYLLDNNPIFLEEFELLPERKDLSPHFFG